MKRRAVRARWHNGASRNSRAARLQKSEFLRVDGSVIDVCGGAPCVP